MSRPDTTLGLVPDGFFVFSEGQETEKRLFKWKKWFDEKGIKSAIIQGWDKKFYIIREGKDAFK
jgi:hypothetical protein